MRVDWRCSELFTKGAHAEMLRDSMGARREARTGEDKAMFTLQNTESYVQEAAYPVDSGSSIYSGYAGFSESPRGACRSQGRRSRPASAV